NVRMKSARPFFSMKGGKKNQNQALYVPLKGDMKPSVDNLYIGECFFCFFVDGNNTKIGYNKKRLFPGNMR
ncbi:MAG: hypothetical protein ACLFP1_08395, partial [Candidatus Goldiibacteriota bacterium]